LCSFGPMESVVNSAANIWKVRSEMFTAKNDDPVSLSPTFHRKTIILSCKWMQHFLPKLHGVTSKKAITLIELSDEAAVHWGSDWTKHRHCWQSVRCVRQGFRLRPINDRQGKPTIYIQIKPIAQSCSGVIKGQSKVLKLLARSSVNYTASMISTIITGGYQWNYSGKIFEDL
jgi:hypothetical protein